MAWDGVPKEMTCVIFLYFLLSSFLLADKRTGSRAVTLVVAMPNKRAEMRLGVIVSSRREVEDATVANYKKQ
jgi:hypothetical protein